MQTIAEFLAKKLWLLNKEHPGVAKISTNAMDSIVRVRTAIEKHNSRQNNELGLEGIDLSQKDLTQMQIAMPDAFKQKPVTYTATASHFDAEGEIMAKTSLALEIWY